MLQALAAHVREGGRVPGPVVLFEAGERPGRGLPYGETADPHHTMGRTRTLRRDKGRQLEARLAQAVATLRGAGVALELRTRTPVLDLEPTAEGHRLHTGEGQREAERVVLATGHWHVPRLAHLSSWVDWQWDVRRLRAAIEDGEDVLILGAQQSALDVATSLGLQRAGRPGMGRIHLVSRLGVLPGVFGHVGRKEVATLSLEALTRAPQVTLEALLEAVVRDAEAVAGRSLRLREWTPERLAARTAGLDGTRLLRHELSLAARSHRQKRPRPWHPVLWHGLPRFYDLLGRLSAEDRLRLAAHWTPLLRHAEAIHPEQAARVLALLEAGVVELHALGPTIRLGEAAGRVWAEGPRGRVEAARVVDARGPDPRLDRATPIGPVQRLLQRDVIASGRVAFRDRATLPATLPEGWSIERRGDTDWLITGGLWVDPETFAVRDPQGRTRGLWALGPLTVGQFPFYAGLWATREAAGRIVRAAG